MKVWCLIIIAAIVGTSAFCGNFPDDFQNAANLLKRGKYAVAEKAFSTLSGSKVNQYGKDECLAYAAQCAAARRDYVKAGDYADKIKDKYRKTLCEMELLFRQRKWAELIKLCGYERFESWPDRLVFNAAFIRGQVQAALKNAPAAEKDFILAKNSTMSERNLAYVDLCLGNLYRDQLKNKAKAIAAFNAAAGTGTLSNAVQYNAALSCASLLSKDGRKDEALKMLDRFKAESIKPVYWKCRIFTVYGDVYAASGNKSDALRYYKQAMEIPKVPATMIESVKKKISGLGKNKN